MKVRLIAVLVSTYILLIESSIIPSTSDAASELEELLWQRRKPKKHELKVDEDYPKYFHEPDGSEVLHHYDSRYHHAVLGFDDKTVTQVHLIRSYLEFFQKNHLETWLAHGTLLGWWWNGKLLPWDWDIDTQVSIATMIYLAEHHNATKYAYTSSVDTELDPVTAKRRPITRKYHLDVNPAIYTRHRGDGANIIDARWIDIDNGLYIDITAVAETRPNDSPGVWACKNYHRYETRHLWPMREVIFEGATAKVPYAYADILTREYDSKALVFDEFLGHKWSPLDHVWVKKTSKEIKQEGPGRKSERQKKQEEKAEKVKEENEREKGRLFQEDQEQRERERQDREAKRKEEESANEQEEEDSPDRPTE